MEYGPAAWAEPPYSREPEDIRREHLDDAATDVYFAACAIGWFTEDELDVLPTEMPASLKLRIAQGLSDYVDERRGIWPHLPARLRRAWDSYIALDEEAARIEAAVERQRLVEGRR